MKSVIVAVLMSGAVLLGISSCATGPKGGLATDEIKLLEVDLLEKEGIKANKPFMVSISFEANGNPNIRTACFYFSGDGPYCFPVLGVQYGSPGIMKVKIRIKNPGQTMLEAYIVYIRDGKTQWTNLVSTYFRVPF